MWVCIRPRGGQDCYLLMCETRGGLEFCPIHRFDGMDQNLMHWSAHTGKSYLKKDCAFVSRKKIKNETRILLGRHCSTEDYRRGYL
jgi:hypothetical protein